MNSVYDSVVLELHLESILVYISILTSMRINKTVFGYNNILFL